MTEKFRAGFEQRQGPRCSAGRRWRRLLAAVVAIVVAATAHGRRRGTKARRRG